MTDAAGPLFDVVVLGAGPAGAAVARALAAKGFSIAIISKGVSSGVQGLSGRALTSLTEAGFNAAADSASSPATRAVFWAGQRSARGREGLIERTSFDVRLHSAVRGRAVVWIDAAVSNVANAEEAWQVTTSRGPVRGRTLIDARGRFARRSDARGPLLVSWTVVLETGRQSAPQSAVAALDDGWCWIARTPGGILSAQFVGSATTRLGRGQVAEKVDRAALSLIDFGVRIDRLTEDGTYRARAAVARYSKPSRGPGHLRVGDATVSMDPLSGNGIHEALRSAHVAVAAISSYLLGEPWPVVSRFLDERSGELWRRSVRSAADFYRQQADWCGVEFWTSAAAEYERAAEQSRVAVQAEGHFEMRPVLNGDRIELRRLWVSREWPRGIWTVDGHSLEQAPADRIPSILRRASGAAPQEV